MLIIRPFLGMNLQIILRYLYVLSILSHDIVPGLTPSLDTSFPKPRIVKHQSLTRALLVECVVGGIKVL